MFISHKNENPIKQKLERPGIERYQVYQKTAFLFTCHIWILYLELSDLPTEREYEHYPGKHDVVSMFLSKIIVYHVLLHNFKFPDKLPFDTVEHSSATGEGPWHEVNALINRDSSKAFQ